MSPADLAAVRARLAAAHARSQELGSCTVTDRGDVGSLLQHCDALEQRVRELEAALTRRSARALMNALELSPTPPAPSSLEWVRGDERHSSARMGDVALGVSRIDESVCPWEARVWTAPSVRWAETFGTEEQAKQWAEKLGRAWVASTKGAQPDGW